MNEIEVYVLIDDLGDYVVATYQGGLEEAYTADVDCNGSGGKTTRIIAIKLTVPTPQPVVVKVVVPDEVVQASARVDEVPC